MIQGDSDFEPQYDTDGNQTLVQTATGIWQVVYNALDRPVRWTSLDGTTVVECTYDYQGRRTMKKVTVNGLVTQHQYFMYRGYQVIAAIDAVTGNSDWLLVWDPAYSTATRPLAFCQGDQVYTYGFDLTKNVCELFDESGQIAASYDYSPYGALLQQTGNLTHPFQWSSEYVDGELGLVYYNYRHYNPRDGRWISRDPIGVQGGKNLYGFVGEEPVYVYDILGTWGINDFVSDLSEWGNQLSQKISDAISSISSTILNLGALSKIDNWLSQRHIKGQWKDTKKYVTSIGIKFKFGLSGGWYYSITSSGCNLEVSGGCFGQVEVKIPIHLTTYLVLKGNVSESIKFKYPANDNYFLDGFIKLTLSGAIQEEIAVQKTLGIGFDTKTGLELGVALSKSYSYREKRWFENSYSIYLLGYLEVLKSKKYIRASIGGEDDIF